MTIPHTHHSTVTMDGFTFSFDFTFTFNFDDP